MIHLGMKLKVNWCIAGVSFEWINHLPKLSMIANRKDIVQLIQLSIGLASSLGTNIQHPKLVIVVLVCSICLIALVLSSMLWKCVPVTTDSSKLCPVRQILAQNHVVHCVEDGLAELLRELKKYIRPLIFAHT